MNPTIQNNPSIEKPSLCEGGEGQGARRSSCYGLILAQMLAKVCHSNQLTEALQESYEHNAAVQESIASVLSQFDTLKGIEEYLKHIQAHSDGLPKEAQLWVSNKLTGIHNFLVQNQKELEKAEKMLKKDQKSLKKDSGTLKGLKGQLKSVVKWIEDILSGIASGDLTSLISKKAGLLAAIGLEEKKIKGDKVAIGDDAQEIASLHSKKGAELNELQNEGASMEQFGTKEKDALNNTVSYVENTLSEFETIQKMVSKDQTGINFS